MTKTAHDLLATFDALSLADQQQVAAEILRRAPPSDELSDEVFRQLAVEVFNAYDAEESARGEP